MKHPHFFINSILAALVVFLAAGLVFAEDAKNKPNQTECPIMGGKINKEVYTDYNGQWFYFCCGGCDKTFLNDPDTYLKKMKAEGVVLEDAPIMQEKCPVSGKAINKKVYTDYNGKRIFFFVRDARIRLRKIRIRI